MSARLVPIALLLALPVSLPAADLPRVTKVELQPLAAQVKRIEQALEYLGNPLSEADRKALNDARNAQDKADGIAAIQAILDKHCLAGVTVGDDKIETVTPARQCLSRMAWMAA